MSIELAIVLLLLAVLALYFGAELSLNSAEKIGGGLGIPPLMTGILIIGLGTSLPEFFVSHLAALRGQGQMAIGNIVGSNITNILLVLGLAIALRRIAVVRAQMNLHFLLTLILSGVLLCDQLYLLSCLVLLAFFGGYLYSIYCGLKREDSPPSRGLPLSKLILFIMGLALLYAGGEGLVRAGGELCRLLGFSEYVISAIFVALGTSLPELLTSFLAVFKKKDLDLVVGNVIGSNIFNAAFVLASLAFYPIDLSRSFTAEIAVLLSASLILSAFAHKRWALNRPLGFTFFAMYASIVCYWLY